MPRMRHPKLPDDQIIDAQESQVMQYQRSGWVVIEDEVPEVIRQLAAAGLTPEAVIAAVAADPPPPTTEQTATEAPADAGASSLPGTDKPRGQRASKGDS